MSSPTPVNQPTPIDPTPNPVDHPTIMNVITNAQWVISAIVVIAALAMAGVVILVILVPGDRTDIELIAGFAVTIDTALFGLLKINDVHLSVNSRLDQLVATTKSDSFQAGHAAATSEIVGLPTLPDSPTV